MSNNLIEVDAINKTYERGGETLVVLDDLSLNVPENDFLALMGPSGSGKSTLLNLIGGLDSPTSGSVRIKGDRLEKMSASALSNWRASNVGFIFQFYNLLPVLTANKNVELPLLLTNLSSSKRKEQVATVLNLVGLDDRGGHKPNELSGGQQQRVAIARALVSDPAILVCDEPTGDLDRETATEILELLQILNRDLGKTILMVTHDPVAADAAKRILYLDKGKLTES
ncbi:MAG TPA: ABC transporter ATP-binding protein [Gammaproteobacteria bacterium]|jgi:putative ABC transport system ATP-binding protein|nr:ABC transporter ATP-binding protein [Gammaproteobacteria bacterium]HIK72539.1 ABC transporter ATP-binding protein [Gammaproteobacteria bacterium]